MTSLLTIAQVNAFALGGGAENVARALHHGYLRRGHRATLLVGRDSTAGGRTLPSSEPGIRGLPAGLGTRTMHALTGVLRIADRYRGRETYHYPATRGLLDAMPDAPDILHLHNLHGGYFDLRVLPVLSARLPVVLTLHDAWLLSGHCAHSMGCERWRTGCGACPDLTIYPAVRVDATAANWQRKRSIFARSRLHIATPSAWLARRVEASMLAPAVAGLRVIPNGVDLDAFAPGDMKQARARLDLPVDGPVLLFVGSGARANPFKDLETVQRAAAIAAATLDRDVTLVVLGDRGADVASGRALTRFVPFADGMPAIADFYRAADLLVHAAHADTFPSTVLEAMACGTPVVATAVGGITEQIRSLEAGAGSDGWPAAGRQHATGVLVAHRDAAAMGNAIAVLATNAPLRAELGRNAVRTARSEYDVERQCDTYLEWYRAIVQRGSQGENSPRLDHAVHDAE